MSEEIYFKVSKRFMEALLEAAYFEGLYDGGAPSHLSQPEDYSARTISLHFESGKHTLKNEDLVTPEVLDAVKYAADVRWQELNEGEPFTIIDRNMLGTLHEKAEIALKHLEPESK